MPASHIVYVRPKRWPFNKMRVRARTKAKCHCRGSRRKREWRLLRPMAREAEAHNLSNVDAKPLTLPCSVIAHLTKPLLWGFHLPVVAVVWRLPWFWSTSCLASVPLKALLSSLFLFQCRFAANYTNPREIKEFSTYRNGVKYEGNLTNLFFRFQICESSKLNFTFVVVYHY